MDIQPSCEPLRQIVMDCLHAMLGNWVVKAPHIGDNIKESQSFKEGLKRSLKIIREFTRGLRSSKEGPKEILKQSSKDS